MRIIKKVFNHNLRKPDSVTVEVFDDRVNKIVKKVFAYPSEAKKVGEWVKSVWDAQQFFCDPARIYYNIGWDCDHVLYAEYRCEQNP